WSSCWSAWRMPRSSSMKRKMHGRQLYEHALIRLVPELARGEFLNVGILVLGKRAGFLGIRTALDEDRLRCLRNEVDLEQVRASELVARGAPTGGRIARLEAAGRFRWLTAVRSAAIQTSPTHAGLCGDLEGTTERLFRELVL